MRRNARWVLISAALIATAATALAASPKALRAKIVDATLAQTSDHFSKWNEPVHVRAPASSTPIATVRG